MDADVEELVKNCTVCQRTQNKPIAAPVHHWEFPNAPWERVHMDHAGPVNGRMFLIVVDSYSKWIEVEPVSSTSSTVTKEVLRKLFATHGLPKVLVSDNAPGFSSEDLLEFTKKNGIRHVFSAPYHPASNGQAERAVRTVKESLKCMSDGDIETKLRRLLFKNHITPQTTTGHSPAELLFKRRLRSPLTLLRPDLNARVEAKNVVGSGRTRSFEANEPVWALNFGRGEKWMAGNVLEVLGATNYSIALEDGGRAHRHVDQLLSRSSSAPSELPLQSDFDFGIGHSQPNEPAPVASGVVPMVTGEMVDDSQSGDPVMEEETTIAADVTTVTEPQEIRRSGRVRQAPARFRDYDL